MNKVQQAMENWVEKLITKFPWMKKTGEVIKTAGNILGLICMWVFRFRSVIMAIPVVWGSLKLAKMNMELLPEAVGINLQASGDYAYLVTRETAVYVPLLITLVCLLMMAISRKTVYPWIISVFSLAIPLLILLTNVFPA